MLTRGDGKKGREKYLHINVVSQMRRYSNEKTLCIFRLAHYNGNMRKANASWCAGQFNILHSTFYNRVSKCSTSQCLQDAQHEAGRARQSKIFKDPGKFLFEKYTTLLDL